jgi:hypothetical protein
MDATTEVSSTTHKHAQWRERIARQRASGKTVEAFCLEENVGKSTFSAWCRRLGVTAARRGNRTQAAPFVDLGPVKVARPLALAGSANMAQDFSAASEVRLELGGGVVLHIARR